MSPSYNHAYLQVNIGALFKLMPDFSVFSELTLTINGVDYTGFRDARSRLFRQAASATGNPLTTNVRHDKS